MVHSHVLGEDGWVEVSDEELARLSAETVRVPRLALEQVLNLLEHGARTGEAVDEPEGVRVVSLSDTLARRLARQLRGEA